MNNLREFRVARRTEMMGKLYEGDLEVDRNCEVENEVKIQTKTLSDVQVCGVLLFCLSSIIFTLWVGTPIQVSAFTGWALGLMLFIAGHFDLVDKLNEAKL